VSGISTVSITLMYEITAKVQVPRAIYVPFPLGRVTGRAHDINMQTQVVTRALQTLEESTSPGEIKKLSLTY
jgi:hypothetical protein